jgi:tetratricopeptide (TPR) repeat protein
MRPKMSEPQEIGGAGYVIATEVCAMLAPRPEVLIECLAALKAGGDGQNRLAKGDFADALSLLRKAHAGFESIREARLLLGITKGDLAAAYGNLQDFDKAISYAEDSIAILGGVKRLAFSEAMARMTLANSLGLLGKRGESEGQYQSAERILKGLPGAARHLQILASNRDRVRGLASSLVSADSGGRNAHRNRGYIAAIIALVAAVAIFYFIWGSQ